MARSRKPARPKAESPSGLCRVAPALGEPWTGRLINPEESEMRRALRQAPDMDDFVIVRCVDAGGHPGLRPGADYLVLRRFVKDC